MSNVREKRDIEWLVNWALERQCVFSSGGSGGYALGGGSPLATMMTMGTIVQGGGSSGLKWTHRDAMVIGDAITAMWGRDEIVELMDLVVMHGRHGTRPDWGKDGIGRYEIVRRGNGKARRRYADQTRQRGLMGFEFEFVGNTHDEVEAMMIGYVGWREALGALRGRVYSQLSTFEPTGPAAPEFPWDDPKRVIHIPGEGVLVE